MKLTEVKYVLCVDDYGDTVNIQKLAYVLKIGSTVIVVSDNGRKLDILGGVTTYDEDNVQGFAFNADVINLEAQSREVLLCKFCRRLPEELQSPVAKALGVGPLESIKSDDELKQILDKDFS